MANSEHVEILRRGVDIWNRWRKENSQVRPDLRRFSCKGPCLTGTPPTAVIEGELETVILKNADLVEADLRGATLSQADLVGADLSGALLQKADLQEANLAGAYLRGATLNGANLFR